MVVVAMAASLVVFLALWSAVAPIPVVVPQRREQPARMPSKYDDDLYGYPVPSANGTFGPLSLDYPDGRPRRLRALYPSIGLRVSGSAQYGRQSFGQVLEFIRTHDPEARVRVVDLRKECHGILVDAAGTTAPVAWLGEFNWATSGMDSRDVLELERLLISIVQRSPVVPVAVRGKDEARSKNVPENDWDVATMMHERDMVTEHGCEYTRVPIVDHAWPDGEAVQQLVEVVRSAVRAGEWLHFHCRAGQARTTMAMTMADMLVNGHRETFDAIVARNRALSGVDLTDIGAARVFKQGFARRRLRVLQQFYREHAGAVADTGAIQETGAQA